MLLLTFMKSCLKRELQNLLQAAELPKTLEEKKRRKKKEPEIQTEDKKKLNPKKSTGKGGTSGGGGDPRARVTAKGVLGIISGAVKGKTVASADIFGKGGFANRYRCYHLWSWWFEIWWWWWHWT